MGVRDDYESGAFMWGMHEAVLEGIKTSKLANMLKKMQFVEQAVSKEPYFTFALDDGSALAWAPSVELLRYR